MAESRPGPSPIPDRILPHATDEEDEPPSRPSTPAPGWVRYLQAVGVVLACTVVSFLMWPYFEAPNLVMVYLLGVMVVALFVGRAAAVLTSILSVAAFDFFFVPPRFTLAVSDTQYLVTFSVMLVAALALSTMADGLRAQAETARRREHRTAVLYRLGRELSALGRTDHLLTVAARVIGEEFEAGAVILLADAAGRMLAREEDFGEALDFNEVGIAQWSYDHRLPAGIGTDTLPSARSFFIPLAGSQGPIGVLGLSRRSGEALRPDQFRFLEAIANQTALAIERSRLAEQAESTRVQVESERLKNALLSSVSHDIRTPLAAITGAATSLLSDAIPEPSRRELTATIAEEAQRLSRQVGNLLEMTRLESGPIEVRREWHLLEESVGAALERFTAELNGRPVTVDVGGAPLAPYDDVLIHQVIFNLIENAIEHTPAGTAIDIRAGRDRDGVWLEVADRGPGIDPNQGSQIFDKFHRGHSERGGRGIGLGLAICRSLIQAHGGRISAANRPGGGTAFRFWLPLEGEPPVVESESESAT
jgi:two-component system sensor histidine kinase KdpD